MNRIIFFFICLFSSFSFLHAQHMREVFGKMPETLFMTVDSIGKQDLMDLYSDNRSARIKDKLNDTCELKVFTEEYLRLENGKNSTEIILLPMINDSKVVCVIRTVCSPVCDSRIAFYTTEWRPLERDIFFTPASYFDFIDESTVEREGLIELKDMDLMEFRFNKDVLIQSYNTPFYLDPQKRDKALTLVKGPVTFRWDKTKFVKHSGQ